jgi:DNA-binding NtrC family response regulator
MLVLGGIAMKEKPKSILIVDDDVDICNTLKDIFADKGYHAEVSNDKSEAVKMAKTRTYDAALIDIILDKVDGGVHVIKELKKIRPNTLFFVMTAYTREDLIVEAFKSGALKLFKKPFDIEEVLTVIAEEVEKKHSKNS